MPFNATCDNTERLGTPADPFAFQVWDKSGNPARLDTTAPNKITYTMVGGGKVEEYPETVGANGFPQYNFAVVSGTLDTETLKISIDADGQPGSGVTAFHDEGVVEVAPAPAAAAAFTVPAASKK